VRRLKTLICAASLLTAACASPSPAPAPVVIQPPRLPDLPAEVMVERPANFLHRLLQLFPPSEQKPTK